MRRFAFKTIVFSLFLALNFILINSIYLGLLILTDWDCKKRIESLKFNNADFDLLALGASTTSCGIDTKYLTDIGIKAYNLALDGATIKTSYFQLVEYLSANVSRPNYVLLGINPPIQKIFDDESINPLVEITSDGYEVSFSDAPILRFRWLGYELLMKIVSRKHRLAELSFGQIKYKMSVIDNTEYSERYSESERVASSKWIGEIVRLCRENGIEIIIVEMPGFKATQNLSNSGFVSVQFANGTQTQMLNLNSRVFCQIFEDDDWIVSSHLNESGALKLTRELANFLTR